MREPSPPGPSTVSSRAGLTEALFAELYPGLRRFAGAISAPVVDPDDLVQEAGVRYIRRAGSEPVFNVGAYLRRSILNLELTRRTTEQRREHVRAQLFEPEATEPNYPSDLAELHDVGPSRPGAALPHGSRTLDIRRGSRTARAPRGCAPHASNEGPSPPTRRHGTEGRWMT